MSEILSRRDLEFLLHEWLDVESLTARERYAEHSRETFDGVLGLSERLATDLFAPHNRAADLAEPTWDGESVHLLPEVKKAVEAYAASDLLRLGFDAEHDGLQLPTVVSVASGAWFAAANIGTTGYLSLTAGNANLLVHHAPPDLVEKFVPALLEGRFLGTMALSEPESGSNLADITTRAVPQDDGTYRLFGQKMWISAGDHELADNIVHLVLAKIPGGPSGTRGISLFLVPKVLVDDDGSLGERNDVTLTGINHKMGWRGTVNTAPSFGSGAFTPGGQPGAVGYLVGEPHRGLSCMFTMMNEARIGVGLAGAALGYTGYLKSLAYARSRPQGRPMAAGPEDPQVPLVEHADVRRMLLAQKAYVEGALALVLYAARVHDDLLTAPTEAERNEASQVLEVLTPIVKDWPSVWCLEANSLAIQVLGGAGYTRDHDVEQHYRDNRLNQIHEGTHGIQGLDLLGRKVLADGGARLQVLGARMAVTIERATDLGGDTADFAGRLQESLDQLASTIGALADLGDLDRMMANSTAFVEAVGHVVVAWIWLEQLVACADKAGDFYDGKRQAAAYFFRWELPRTRVQFDLLASGDDTALSMRDAWF
ncbi:acyl-CoA dehydrogenase domain-containing [Nocardioides sp. CF8]|uniref:acyl-CoA dehydrogenase n=1 Tax=Nocardioides sp. CF8 TaxID=110319 RepID=UPI00032F2022|nr:acyl-CoA dehydrogenase [Nocardioides sp. CF8]EON23131.1 acyl-CoA dehydrogenase domain-containing [Nocardioides sp. CF8]